VDTKNLKKFFVVERSAAQKIPPVLVKQEKDEQKMMSNHKKTAAVYLNTNKVEAGPKPWETSESWSFWAHLDLVTI
jgi:hypothetical protein